MDAREFHKLAIALASRPSAAERRTAISRAYYATFNVAAQMLKDLGFRIRRGAAAHGEVYHCLRNCGEPPVEEAASEINDLHGQRNSADYHLDSPIIEKQAVVNTIVTNAGLVIRTLDQAMSGPRRPHIQAAIASWRRENGYP